MYKALIEIGGYNIGDEVPTDKAELWLSMYKVVPVEKVGKDSSDNDVKVKEEVVSPKNETRETANAMHDDYLNRNTDVVKKAIKSDFLDKSTLQSLLSIEVANKKRAKIIQIIKLKIKSL